VTRVEAGDVYGVRYSRAGLGFWASKPSVVGLRVWASKPEQRFKGGTDGTRWHRGSCRGEVIDEEVRWPSDEDETGLDHNALGLSGLTQLYQGQN
jgi:hypothetical protein